LNACTSKLTEGSHSRRWNGSVIPDNKTVLCGLSRVKSDYSQTCCRVTPAHFPTLAWRLDDALRILTVDVRWFSKVPRHDSAKRLIGTIFQRRRPQRILSAPPITPAISSLLARGCPARQNHTHLLVFPSRAFTLWATVQDRGAHAHFSPRLPRWLLQTRATSHRQHRKGSRPIWAPASLATPSSAVSMGFPSALPEPRQCT